VIYWAQLFHFYQPPTQLPSVLEKICDESYSPLIDVFREYPKAKATFNINGVLTEMLKDCGHDDIIAGFRELGQRGQIEFTGSGKYHPILPLIPADEARRQIELNNKTNAFFFGDAYKADGFFPPEMAYGRDILPSVIDTGHRWIILSGAACPASWPVDLIYQVEHDGKKLAAFFRDDILSNKVSFQETNPKEFLEHLSMQQGDREDVYVVTAMDAETYGHHIKDWEDLFLSALYEQLQVTSETYGHIQQKRTLAAQHAGLLADADTAQRVRNVTITELLDYFPVAEVIDPKPSSWSTTGQDIDAGNPYPLWRDRDNEIHRFQWDHMAICIELCLKATKLADNDEGKHFAGIARGLLDRALQSDQFWWASRRPMWDINLIHMGLIDQWRVVLNACRAITASGADEQARKECFDMVTATRDLRDSILDRLFGQ